jgi:hypothetical protein
VAKVASSIATGNFSCLRLLKITRCPAHFLNQLLCNVVLFGEVFLFGCQTTVRSQRVFFAFIYCCLKDGASRGSCHRFVNFQASAVLPQFAPVTCFLGWFLCVDLFSMLPYRMCFVANVMLVHSGDVAQFIHSFSSLSHDRSKTSSKGRSPYSAI